MGQVDLAEAGFFYFGPSAEASKLGIAPKKEAVNLQTIPLLESSLSYETASHKGGGEITIVNNNSLLPESGPLGTMADVEELNSDWQINVYVVREGDTLSQIAKMFDVSVNTIIWSNDIARGSSIKPGQTLVILPITGVRYEVKKGDTLKSIAKRLNSDVDEIIKFNGLDSNGTLAVGETIIVPNGEMPTVVTPKATKPGTNPYRGGGGPSYAGYYMRPIVGGVKSQGLHGYNGVDLANSCGEPVLASASGNVIISKSAGWNGGYGNYIVVSHTNDTQTLYSHLSTNIVYPGWHVNQGQVIGYIGSTGKSTGCHLHFEVRGAKNPF